MRWHEGRGRTRLCLEVKKIGADTLLWMYGGKKHIGAVALSYFQNNKIKTKLLTVPGHREAELAEALAQKAANVYKTTALATVGIHLDKISQKEINTVMELATKLIVNIY
jgi:hypothetical protein